MSLRVTLCIFLVAGWLLCAPTQAQTVIGMGTETPNKNAVLDLVSEGKNQGFLAPRLTSQQRTATNFLSSLSEADNGLMVFDTNIGAFFYWWNDQWVKGAGEGQLTSSIWYEGSGQPAGSVGKDGDFYINSLSGEVFKKTGGIYFSLGKLFSTSLLSSGEGISIDADNKITNTLPDQEVSISGEGNISVSGSYPHFTIKSEETDQDTDFTNEIQDLSLNSNTLKITGNQAATSISLLPYLDNTDNQRLTFDEDNLQLGITGGNAISLGSINTDKQTLGLSGNQLSISGSTSEVNIAANTPADGQVLKWNAVQNRWEAQDDTNTEYTAGAGVSLDGLGQIVNSAPDQLVTINGNGDVAVSGSYPNFTVTGSDDQTLTQNKSGNIVSLDIENGNSVDIDVSDGDSDATNEKITGASLQAGNILKITEGGTDHTVDLSSLDQQSLDEGKVLVGNASNQATPVSISGDITLNSDGTMTITLDAVTTSKILNSAVTSAKLADGAVTKEKINADVAGNGLSQNADGSLEINVGNGLTLQADQLKLANKGVGEILIGSGSQVNATTISGDISLDKDGVAVVSGLQGRSVSSVLPSTDDVLAWDGSKWAPQSALPSSTSKWYYGIVHPSLIVGAFMGNGSYYFDTDDEIVYWKFGGTWKELGQWVKTVDSNNVQGATVSDTRLPTVFTGTGDPSDGTINNAQPGDLYYDTNEGKLYIKKNNSQWKSL